MAQIDSIYKTVQAILNKEQLGYLKPMDFNLFVQNAQRKIYNQYLSDLKSNVRKSNWMLDGKNLADFSEHTQQLLEHFSTESGDVSGTSGYFDFPEDLEYVEDVYNSKIPISKVDFSDFNLLCRNIYATPNNCSPITSKVGRKLKVAPETIETIQIHYLRKPKNPKWTYTEFEGKPLFDPTKPDFQDIDMPASADDMLISLVVESASIALRDFNVTQLANQEQNQDNQLENRQ